MLKKVDHIGVAVKSLESIKKIYREVFNLEPAFEETVEEQMVRVAAFKIGETNIEYLEPTGEESPIAKYLAGRGEGIHHLAVSVTDIAAVMHDMRSQGIRLIDDAPRIGAEGKKIAFVHPKSLHGVLLELSQDE